MINLNGSGIYSFYNVTENKIYNFSWEHTDFLYDFATYWYMHRLKSGTKARQFRFIEYFFEIQHTDYASNETMMKYQEIINAFLRGDRIDFTPHTDVPQIQMQVFLPPEYAASVNGHLYNQGNKDFHLSLETNPLPQLNWINPEEPATFYLPTGRRSNRII